MYQLAREGVEVYPASPHLHYDLVADVGGRLIRIQVKGTVRIQNSGRNVGQYRWVVHGQKKYKPDDFDIVALVALDVEKVAFRVFDGQVIYRLSPPGAKRHVNRTYDDIDQYPFAQALLEVMK